MPMEPKLRAQMLKLFETYSFHAGGAYTTISARVTGDARFYDRLVAEVGAFSAHRYDLVVATFGEIWPEDLMWPPEIERIRMSDVRVRTRKPRAKSRTAPKRSACKRAAAAAAAGEA